MSPPQGLTGNANSQIKEAPASATKCDFPTGPIFFEGGSAGNAKRVKTRSFVDEIRKCFVEKQIENSLAGEEFLSRGLRTYLRRQILKDPFRFGDRIAATRGKHSCT
jgi:hypothetical protein